LRKDDRRRRTSSQLNIKRNGVFWVNEPCERLGHRRCVGPPK
jgi:hypothetical protein